MARQVFVYEAVLDMSAAADARAPGGAITVELCGHWEHDGPCQWPHHSHNEPGTDGLTLRTAFACQPDETNEIAGRIAEALQRQDAWSVLRSALVEPTPDEHRMAENWRN